MKTEQTFEEHLRKGNLSENTITSYLWTVNYFHEHYDKISKDNLLAYKGYLMEFFKPKTVNLRIQGINKYLEYLGKEKLQLKAVKVQQKNFLENVISNADYKFLKTQLKKDGNMEWYFVVWYLAATGARVSELIQIKIEHVEIGYFDLYTKGGKLRRLYIPKMLRNETLEWLNEANRTSGYLFLNRYGDKITPRGISQQLKNYANKYGLDKKVVYPHSFRHRYAKNFLEKFNDIALLADLMGHESIETIIYCLISNIQARKKLLEMQKGYHIVSPDTDELLYAGFSKESARDYIDNFEKFLLENKDSIEALRIIYNSEDVLITHTMLCELQERLLAESKQYGIYQIWKNYKLLDTESSVEELDIKSNVNMLTNLIQIVRFAYRKNTKLTSLLNGYAQRFSLYCGQAQRVLTEEQKEIMKLIAEYILNEGAISIAELNAVDTDLWRKGVMSFGILSLSNEMQTLSKFILKVA